MFVTSPKGDVLGSAPVPAPYPQLTTALGLHVCLTEPAKRAVSREPLWPSGKALGWWVDGPQFVSSSAFLSLQNLWITDTACLVTIPLQFASLYDRQEVFVFIGSGQNYLARHSERGKKTRQTEEEVGTQHQGMERPWVRQVPEGSGEQGKWRELAAKSSVVPLWPSRSRDRWWWWCDLVRDY